MGQWNMVWFEWFHLYLWQALIILDALVVWLIWLRMLPPRQSGPGDGGSGGSDGSSGSARMTWPRPRREAFADRRLR